MTRGGKRSKGDSDGGQTHLGITADGPGIDDRGIVQQRAPIETRGIDAETADARPAASRMMPLTHSKMHEIPVSAPEQPALPRRSALVIEILSFVLIAFLVVSALLFNLTAPRTLISAPPSVSVQLPPKPVERSDPFPAAGPVVQEEPPAAETVPVSTAVLQDVQPQAGLEVTPQAEPPAEAAALPPATPLAAPEPSTDASIEAAPPPPPPADETASLPLPAEETQALIRRGDELLDTGDIVAARSAFERAAASGNRVAALGVAKTYDPVYLMQAGVRGLRGDPARAALWYGKAAAAGDREAQQRLRRLRAQFPQ